MLSLIMRIIFSFLLNVGSVPKMAATYVVPDHETFAIVQLSNKKGSTADRIIHELLQSGDSSQKYMQGSRSMKIDNCLLLDSFVQVHSVSTSARARAIQSHSKRSKKHMSMQQHRKHGSFDFSKEFHK